MCGISEDQSSVLAATPFFRLSVCSSKHKGYSIFTLECTALLCPALWSVISQKKQPRCLSFISVMGDSQGPIKEQSCRQPSCIPVRRAVTTGQRIRSALHT